MKPDNPKEYMIKSLNNLLDLVERGNISLGSIQEEPIGFPNLGYERFVRGRRITLELYYETENRN